MDNKFFAPKIFTASGGFVKENILGGIKAVDIGCGQRKLPGAVGMDILSDSAADVIHDAGVFPWPFHDNAFDLVFMNNVLEHVVDVPKTMGEAHRIAKPGARVVIQVPYFRAVDAFADPTHIHFYAFGTLDYFIEGAKWAGYKYVPFRYKKLGFWYGWPHKSKNPLKQLLKVFIHKHPDFYDQYLSLLFPTECVTWELEVLK
ncbi:hypothetical protein A2W54_00825 [Candidatus Giovannonibacteria bacterium RIFCSPHIGHO2_02_43_13]|uniref:Methyltransferase type 11 domain-containing protein n=1 Tax=Candidatus Giovannonibacteria bacterium RIFCSPHIGHO2_02_43_13 TaxID=1798330 RepID=A0A1F5WRX0_9BACT|nr:MAG: hypothetical protein A3E06_02260 [Candidatus Giovannonibacteria bacterium RIFCSPHIGHO2_12_FULL_44_42]OGF78409.1 MAG: hypothetical protein A2W54_00825 [Candidatus Giovannonibacteria bacterium RIFCSPHIGHO2_02_43_13]OGF97240.1 MAG: hypothetical protein A3H08_00345 [Candidatus Giovannonibacteria bacterium RIFCSPLOWO2_12_FULL_44_32]